jgi:hypothetical protein
MDPNAPTTDAAPQQTPPPVAPPPQGLADAPMFDPTGTSVRMVPAAMQGAALQAGAKHAVKMIDPSGTPRWIPEDQQEAAVAAGAKPIGATATPQGNGQTTGWQDLKQQAGEAVQGATASFSQVPATLMHGLQKIPGVGPWLSQHTDLDSAEADYSKAAASTPDTVAGKTGSALWSMAEWMAGEGAVGAGVKAASEADYVAKVAANMKILERSPRLVQALMTHPALGYLGAGAKQAVVGTTLAAAHGASAGEALKTGAEAGAIGAALPALFDAGKAALGSFVDSVKPSVENIEGVDYTKLASEGADATPRQKAAAQLGSEPALRDERQRAFQQMQTNLAKKGIGNALQQSNDALAASGVGDDVQAAQGPLPTPSPTDPNNTQWRYIPPDGSASMTAEQTRSAMNELKQRWLDQDWGPRQDQAFQQAYNDMRDQLARRDAYTATQPIQAHDVAAAVDGVNSYADAAAHLDATSQQTLQKMDPETRAHYLDLIQTRNDAQDAFDHARFNQEEQQGYHTQINNTNGQIENLLSNPDSSGGMTSQQGEQALKQQRLSAAFQDLQNTMDKHFNLTADTAAATGIPRKATNLSTLASDIERVRTKYGDVLDPVLGKDGLNHIIELGNTMDVPTMKDSAKTLRASIGQVIKNRYLGIRGLGGAELLHTAGHLMGGVKGALAASTAEGAYRMFRNQLATDPAFAERYLYAAKNAIPPRHAAPLLASMITTPYHTQPTQEPQPNGTATPSQ